MLFIVILAFIATVAFYRQAKLAKVHPGKAGSIPFIAAGLFLTAQYCATLVINQCGIWADVASSTIRTIVFMSNVFFFLAYVFLIRRNWIALTNRVDRASE